ncbi:hypothetical protein QWY97_02340 [Vibrio cortegadensis]|uniref:hypothetical protein n=1 Tax=Vibrio cortegadensis TaxID=1328770 RepID=UPI0021C2F3E9|nr:hypothetical protein [Vibrio cortegadensis]MDN3696193.1 hypothetical protein [Vibrio cortegadensis]
MQFKAISSFFSEINNVATEMEKAVRAANHMQKQTSSTRVEVKVIEAKIELLESEIELTESLQEMSKEQLKIFYGSLDKNGSGTVRSVSELNSKKSELEQQLYLKQRLLQQQTEIAKNEIK